MFSPRFRQRNGNANRDLSLARELLLGIQAAGVPTYRQTIPAIAAELRRCRRYERPLAVLTVSLEGPNVPSADAEPPAQSTALPAGNGNGVLPAGNGNGALVPAVNGNGAAIGNGAVAPLQSGLDCVLFLLLGTLLRDVTRESDLVTYAAEEHVYALFLTEAGCDAAEQAARRLARALHARAGVRIRAGIAEFPGNGLTVESLFDHAIRVLARSQPVPLENPALPAEEAEWQNLRSAR